MIESFIKTYTYDNNEIQRVQAVTLDSFEQLHFMFPKGDERTFEGIVNLYRNFIVPKAPYVFGRLILIYLPEEECRLSPGDVRVNSKGRLIYRSREAQTFCENLIARNRLAVVCGRLMHTKILPVGNALGYLSESLPAAGVRVNSNFFVMDCFDVASPSDKIGAPIGLAAENGKVLNPPAFGREAFLVHHSGHVEIRTLNLSELSFVINGCEYSELSGNAAIYERPSACHISSLSKGLFIVIVGCRVKAVFRSGGFTVPCSGFVLRIKGSSAAAADIHEGDTVEFKGLEDIRFGVQVGNSIIINGRKTTGFISRFYNIYRSLGMRAYPPSLYPLDYDSARAPRIALGAFADGKPCLLWAEGPKKTGYVIGEQSCGASLKEMADIAEDLGIVNAVNLDGGGSAQMLVNGERLLEVSDRNPENGSVQERAVPLGIYADEIQS